MPIEPVILTVSQVRAAIAAAEPAREPAPVNALTGGMFHAVAARVLSPDTAESWQALTPEDVASPPAIQRHLYHRLLAPRLHRSRAALQGGSEEVRYLWRAVQSFSRWLSDVLRTAMERGQISYDAAEERWHVQGDFAQSERELAWELRENNWRSTVRVEGRLDALIRHASGRAWCVVEYKLSHGPSLADLGQLCLYREMLGGGDAAIALVRFGTEIDETVYSGADFSQVRRRLVELIGELAGVTDRGRVETVIADISSVSPLHSELGQRLIKALSELGSPARLSGPPVAGPVFVRFPIAPERGVRSAAILRQGQELQVRLGLPQPPVIHVSETGQVVVDVARPDPQAVPFRLVCNQIPEPDDTGTGVWIPIGVNLAGRLRCSDLTANPHVLVAGTTGSGKSEWLRMALAGLLLRNTPESLRVVCIDPKMNAFGDMKESPFLMTRGSLVYPPNDSAVNVFEELVVEMSRRQALFERAGADDLRQYVRKTGDRLPRIVCFCDEYANLIANRGERTEIEDQIARIGSMGRSSGIHLVIATQQPSRKIIGGALATNLPCRVALMTKSAIESRMLLEESGAENLLGRGDLLFWDVGKPVRLQAPLLGEEERRQIYRG